MSARNRIARIPWIGVIALTLQLPVLCGCGGGSTAPRGTTGPLDLVLQMPSDGATVTESTVLSVGGPDVDLLSGVSFGVDGEVVFVDLDSPFEWALDPESLAAGSHSVFITAGEITRTVTITIVEASPPPPASGPTMDPGFAAPTNRIDFAYDSGLTAYENGDRLEIALESLTAGDRLVIGAGTYLMDSRISINAVGTEASTISIEAAENADVTIEQTNFGQNGVDFDNVAWLTVRGIEFVGGDIGIRLTNVHHLYFVDNEVHDCADAAITANSADTSYLYFVDNHIHDTDGYGEGFYLGANYALYVTHHTYVVGNYVHDTAAGPNALQGDGIEIKDGSYACVISDNRVERTNYPGILVYGNGGRPERNLIERNVILNSSEGGIQVAADAIVRNNLIIDADDACIVSQAHQSASPSNLTIVNNTLVNYGVCLRMSSWVGSGIVAANNALYSEYGTETAGSSGSAVFTSNVVLPSLDQFVDLTLDGSSHDATPAAGSSLIGAGDGMYAPEDDLNGTTRTGSVEAGAVDLP